MTTAAAPITAPVSSTSPGFWALLRSEWTKLRSVRSTWIMISLANGLSIGFSALIAVITGLTYDSWNDAVQAEFSPVLTTMSGWLFGMIFLIVLGVTTVTSEYNSRMIRTTLIVSPGRYRVFAAKGTVVGLIGLAVSVIVIPGMFLISQPIFGLYGIDTASVTDSETARFLIAGSLQGPMYTLIPFAVAWLMRGTASTITASIGFFFLPWMMGPLLPIWVKENVLRFLPDNAKDSMIGMVDTNAPTYIADGPALVVVATWVIGSLIAGAVVLNRRDV